MKLIPYSLLLIASAYALNKPVWSEPVPFSPYADVTLNTHWDPATQSLAPKDYRDVSKESGVKQFRFAFITDADHCNPAWGGQTSYAVKDQWGVSMMQALAKEGIQYTLSLGGANGNDLSLYCTKQDLVAQYEAIIQLYQPNGLDFDIENGTANVERVMSSLAAVQANHPEIKLSFTLPVLPEGLTANGKEIVKQALAHQLTFHVNIMAMDYGSAYSGDMGQYAMDASQHLHDFLKKLYPTKTDTALWQMVEVTPMIGVNDVQVEQFTLDHAAHLKQFAQQHQLGALSMWSITRDFPCADRYASATCSGNHLQSTPYAFSRQFG